VVFDRVQQNGGACIQYVLLKGEGAEAAVLESQKFALDTSEDDQETILRHDSFTLHLSRPRVIEQGEIVSGGYVKSTLLRNALAKFSGNPYEKKMVSDATLNSGTGVFTGRAIHERVTWHWE
jgi:hypothetical protein